MSLGNLPNEPSLMYIALLLLILGLFLFIAGLGIVSVEKISVLPGIKTWSIGLVLMLFGILLMLPKFSNSHTVALTDNLTNQARDPSTPILAPSLPSATRTSAVAVANPTSQLPPTARLAAPTTQTTASATAQLALLDSVNTAFYEQIIGSEKTQIYTGSWQGITAKMFIEWEDYQNQGGKVRGFIQAEDQRILERFTGSNDAFRQLSLELNTGGHLQLNATVKDKLKIWEGTHARFEHHL